MKERTSPEPGRLVPIGELKPRGCASRRQFCVGAGAGLVALGAGCTGGPERVLTGQLDDETDGTRQPTNVNPDGGADLAYPFDAAGSDLAHSNTPSDLATPPPVCGTSSFSAGPASAIAMGMAKYFTSSKYDVFVCRDAGGLYAMDAACTHSGCILTPKTTQLHCDCHGANFDLNGEHATLPAFLPLQHYALCVDASGNITVDYKTKVSSTVRT
jgi:nitrite reductase/ring-hydroxylating ferredoxin subunit